MSPPNQFSLERKRNDKIRGAQNLAASGKFSVSADQEPFVREFFDVHWQVAVFWLCKETRQKFVCIASYYEYSSNASID